MSSKDKKFKKNKRKKSRYNYGSKVRTSFPVKVFKVVSIFLCILLTLMSLLHICTRRENIKDLTNSYVMGADIDSGYYDRYIEEGFTEDMVKSFFEDKVFLDVVSNVMSDRLSVLFDYRDSYIYSMDYCEDELTKLFKSYSDSNNLHLTDETISLLVKYTCDVSGISAMFIYDTPASYRTSIFEAEANYDGYNNIFEVMSVLSSIDIVITLAVMYIVCLVILFVLTLDTKEVLPQTIADTVLVPSFIFVGISLGELFVITNTNEVQDYVFGHLLKLSLLFLVLGVILYVICLVILMDNKEDLSSVSTKANSGNKNKDENKKEKSRKNKRAFKSIKKVPDVEEDDYE